MSQQKIIYILACRCVIPGTVGVIEFDCMNGHGWQKVADVHTFEWKVICENCNYHPWCGLSQMLGNHTANGHSRKHPQHRVHVKYTENPMAKKVQEKILEGTYNADNSSTASRNRNE